MRQRVIAGVGVLALIGLVFALNFYRLPVVALSPGPMEDVLARLKVEGSRVYHSEGKLYLTSVGVDDNVRFYEALLDMANRDIELVPRAQLYPDEQDSSEVDRENAVLMDRSKETATVVALREVGYDIAPSGVEETGLPAIVSIARTCPLPGVRISSASVDTGSSPPNSGSSRTRCSASTQTEA